MAQQQTALVSIPTKARFLRGVREFEKRERREAMYRVATFLIEHFWGKPAGMADGLGVLLLTWNQAFYRYGRCDFERLEDCVRRNFKQLRAFRRRSVESLAAGDEPAILALFDDFLRALRLTTGKLRGNSSPVAVANE